MREGRRGEQGQPPGGEHRTDSVSPAPEAVHRWLRDHISDALVLTDDRFVVKQWNPAATSIFGYVPQQALQQELDPLLDTRYLDTTFSHVRTRLDEHGSWQGPVEQVRRDGVRLRLLATLQRLDSGEHLALYRDVTEVSLVSEELNAIVAEHTRELKQEVLQRRAAQEQLRLSEEKYRALFEHASLGIFRSTFEGRFLDANPALASMLGYPDTQSLIANVHDIASEIYVDPPKRTELLQKLEQGGGFAVFENTYRRRSGEHFFARLHLRVVHGPGGEPECLEGIVEDITEQRRMLKALRDSEQAYRDLAGQIPGGAVYVFDRDCRYTMVEGGILEEAGFSREDFLGKTPEEALPPEGAKHLRSVYDAALRGERTETDFPFGGRHYHMIGSPLRTEDGAIRGGITLTQDVTRFREVQQLAREREERLATLYDAIPDALFVHEIFEDGTVGRFLDVNDTACERLGYSREELLSMDVSDIDATPDEGGVDPAEVIRKLLEHSDGRAVTVQQVHRTRSGRLIPVEIHARTFRYGENLAVVSVVRDTTERVRSERELQQRSEMIRSLAHALPDIPFILDSEGIYRDVFTDREELLVLPKSELIGKRVDEVLPGDVAAMAMRAIRDAVASGDVQSVDYEIQVPAGERIFEGRVAPLPLGPGQQPRVVFVARDVTENRRTLERLAASEAQVRIAHELARLGSVTIDLQSGQLRWSPRAMEVLGIMQDTLLGEESFFSRIHEEDRERVVAAYRGSIEERVPFHAEYRLKDSEGQIRHILASGKVLELHGRAVFLGTFQDITERMKIREALLASARLEASATLAGGFAHDINNLMTGIMGNADLLKIDCPGRRECSEILDSIIDSSSRSSGFASELLAFTRQGKFHTRALDLTPLVQDVLRRARGEIPAGVEIRPGLAEELPRVMADRNQMSLMVHHLLKNAVEAVEGSGRILVETAVVRRSDVPGANPHAPAHSHVQFLVEDDGQGMRADVLERACEPMFSTKAVGRGMGLAAVHGIVESHEGRMTIASEPGRGTRVEILLPATTSTPLQ